MVRRRLPLAAVLAGLLLLGGSAYLSVHPAAPRGATARPAPATAPIIGADWFRTDASKAPVHHQGLRIKILGLGVDLPVVEGDGLTAPLYEAAHYPGMKWPGEGGRTLIYAHARAGMFGPLFGAHVGQQIQIARPDAPTLSRPCCSQLDVSRRPWLRRDTSSSCCSRAPRTTPPIRASSWSRSRRRERVSRSAGLPFGASLPIFRMFRFEI